MKTNKRTVAPTSSKKSTPPSFNQEVNMLKMQVASLQKAQSLTNVQTTQLGQRSRTNRVNDQKLARAAVVAIDRAVLTLNVVTTCITQVQTSFNNIGNYFDSATSLYAEGVDHVMTAGDLVAFQQPFFSAEADMQTQLASLPVALNVLSSTSEALIELQKQIDETLARPDWISKKLPTSNPANPKEATPVVVKAPESSAESNPS